MCRNIPIGTEKKQANYRQHFNMQKCDKKQDRYTNTGEKLFGISIDLRAAFDTIERHTIINCLEKSSTSNKLINIVKWVYRDLKDKIQMSGKVSAEFTFILRII